jgi:hypothetical protein
MSARTILLATSCVLVGCSSGEDVNVGYASGRQAVRCVAPGDNVCSHTFGIGDPVRRKETAETLQAAADFAAEARAALTAVDEACLAMGREFAVGTPPPIGEITPREHATIACTRIAEVLATKNAAKFALDVRNADCEPYVLRPCVTAWMDPARRCASAQLSVTLAEGANDHDRAIASAIEQHLPRVLGMRSRIETAASLAGTLSSRVGTLTDVPASCGEPLAQMLREAVGEISTATELAAKLTAAAR